MKVKKLHGEIINGFLIVDSYPTKTKTGGTTRRVLLKCPKCGAEFERSTSVEFSNIRHNCQPKIKRDVVPRKKYSYNGKEYYLFQLAEMTGTDSNKIGSRIRAGYSIEEAITKVFDRTCVICGKEFQTENIKRDCCCSTCQNRKNHGKGAYSPIVTIKCKVCETEFQTRDFHRAYCSQKCANKAARKQRKEFYKVLRHSGHYDNSISLISVFEKFGGKCNICGKSTDMNADNRSPDYPTIDHITPLIRGGYHEWDNIQLLCKSCNCSKHSKV